MFQISIQKQKKNKKKSFSEFGFGQKSCFRIWDFPETIPKSFKWLAFIIRTTNNQSNFERNPKIQYHQIYWIQTIIRYMHKVQIVPVFC